MFFQTVPFTEFIRENHLCYMAQGNAKEGCYRVRKEVQRLPWEYPLPTGIDPVHIQSYGWMLLKHVTGCHRKVPATYLWQKF